MDKILNKQYYSSLSTLELSKNLLGKILVHKDDEGTTSGMIVETEAYLCDDPACHAYNGKVSLRNKSVFEEAGTSYVYFIYGTYFCFNVAGNRAGIGEAVLIRALEPIEGIELMRERIMNRKRKLLNIEDIINTKVCNGPGKLCVAMNITKNEDGLRLFDNKSLFITTAKNLEENEIVTTTRIGLTKAAEKPYRFYIKDNPFISKK